MGKSAPQNEPDVSSTSIMIGAATPGTPSMRASPWYSTSPPGVRMRAMALSPEFTMWMRTTVSPSSAGRSPCSMANGPTPASMFPQLGLTSTTASFTTTCANR